MYLKVLLKKDVPVGAIILGTPTDVSSFGVLRSYILRKMTIPDALFPGNLTGKPIWPFDSITFNNDLTKTFTEI